MKRWSKVLAAILAIVLLFSGTSIGMAADKQASISILFTHDLHDNLQPFTLEKNGVINEYGGYARLETAIAQQREKDPDLLLVDAGDYSMGTLYQAIYSQEAPGLRLLGKMGYDVVTLGNHEFDFRPAGLAYSLNAALTSKDRLPFMVAGNIKFPQGTQGDLGASLNQLKNAMNTYGVKNYTIIKRKGVKIGVFGIIGKDAASNAPMAGVEFTDPIEQARQITDILKNKEKVDLIVCLSHSGTSSKPKESEDVILAQKVPEINVIISGHSHTKLDQPIVVGNTVICSTGEYGQNLGKLVLQKSSSSSWRQAEYRLIPINSSISADPSMLQTISQFKSIVQKEYLDPMNLTFDGVLARSPFSFAPISQITVQHDEQPLANLIADAYIYAIRQAEGEKYQPIDIAIVPNGTIRASFVKGNITVSDAFNVSSLGIGPDKRSGYPLISVYLTGKEVKTACEVDASIAPMMNAAQLYMSGLTYTFNPHRLIFNKVTDAALLRPDGSREEIDDNKLYRVAVGLYSAQMLSVVGEKSHGLLSIIPKTKEGKPITDFEAQIIKEDTGGTFIELKEWAALAEYLQSFPKVDGVAQVPSYYNQKHGRKIVDHRTSIGAVVSNPNMIAMVVYGFIVLILLLLILVIRHFYTRKQKKIQPNPNIIS